jgi:lysophospholipase L1-like esterase
MAAVYKDALFFSSVKETAMVSLPTAAPLARRPMSPLRKLLFTTLIVAFLIGGAEGALRVANGWNRHWIEMHRFHPVLGWSLRESWEGSDSWVGGYGRINAQGIRGNRPALPKPAGEKRLLALGDSITFGALVRTDDTWPARLDALLQPSSGWRVLNGGVTSYDPAQEADWLELFGWQLEPDALAIGFCRNDLCPSDRAAPRARESMGASLRWLTEHSILACRLQKAVWYVQARLGGATPTLSASAATQHAELSGWPLVEQSYRRIARAAQARGLPVVLVIFPTVDLLEGRQPDDLSARLSALGAELGWTVIDVSGAFATNPVELFAPKDPVHPNAEGYQRAAAWIATALKEQATLP